MSDVTGTVNQITADIVQYTPAVVAGVQAAEQSSASGQDKKQAVLDAIQAGSAAASSIPVPQVAAIAGLINLVVSIFNSLGIFKHKTPTAVVQPNELVQASTEPKPPTT